MKKRLAIGLAVVLGLAGLLAACGKSDNSPTSSKSQSSSATGFNAADVTFAQSMIPHHQQAVEMAKMADMQASSRQVRDLALRIKNAQGPEIKQMQGWLKEWGKSAMSSGMDMGQGTGMMSAADMKTLGKATGAKFDKLFLTMMVSHHKGALTMAKTELSMGKNAKAKALATRIIKGQQAEITEMQALLQGA